MRWSLRFLLIGLFSFGIPAFGFTKDEIVQPIRDDIELCKEALTEMGRQGEARAKQIEEWKSYFERCKKEQANNVQRLKEEQQRRVAADDKISSVHGSLALDEKGNAHVPHHGWGIPGQILDRKNETNKVIAGEDEAVGKGEMAFHYAGIGWMNGKQLDEAIAAQQKQLTDFRQAMTDGTFSIHFPGIGWINKQQAASRIADDEKKIRETLETIDKGEYSIHLPNIGWMTRNQLQGKIKETNDELAKLREQFQKEEASIHRAMYGWLTLGQLHQNMEGKKKEIEALEKNRAEKTFSHSIPTRGWTTGKDLEANIQTIDTDVANIQKQVANQEYSVPLSTGGWANAKGINEALKDPKLDPKVRAALNKGLSHIPLASQVDIAIRQLEQNKLKGWLGVLGSHAESLLDKMKTELAQMALDQGEYAAELNSHQKRIERTLKWLNQNLALFP